MYTIVTVVYPPTILTVVYPPTQGLVVSGETDAELNTLMLCDAIMDDKASTGTKSQVLAEMLVMQRGSKVMLNLGKDYGS